MHPAANAMPTLHLQSSRVCRPSTRLSVRPSVTSRSCTKTAKRRITQTTPHGSPGSLVLRRKTFLLPIRSPTTGAPNAGGVGKNCVFSRSRSPRLRCLTAQNLCPSATVVHVLDGALAEEYAVSSRTLVAVEV